MKGIEQSMYQPKYPHSHDRYIHLKIPRIILVVLAVLSTALLSACTATTPDTTPMPTLPPELALEPTATDIPPTPTSPPATPTSEPAPTIPPPTEEPTLEVLTEEGNGIALSLPQPAEGAPGLAATTNVNVRSGPGVDYASYGVLLEGNAATITGVSSDGAWWVVDYPEAALDQGWVSGEFTVASNATDVPVVQPPPVPPTLRFTSPPAGNTPQGLVVDNIYLRSGPGTEYTAYGVIPARKTATIIGRNRKGDWWTIQVNSNLVPSQHGWVPAAYVRAQNVRYMVANPIQPIPDYADLSATAEGAPAAYPMTPVYLRSGPGLEYPVLGTASPDTIGEITGISANGEWWQLSVPLEVSLDGLAWVTAPFIFTANAGEVPVVEPPAVPKAVESIQPSAGDPSLLTLETVNFFAGPGNEWPLLGVLPGNAQAVVLGISPDSNWYIVRIPRAADPGGRGWVSAEFVEVELKRGVPIVEPPPK